MFFYLGSVSGNTSVWSGVFLMPSELLVSLQGLCDNLEEVEILADSLWDSLPSQLFALSLVEEIDQNSPGNDGELPDLDRPPLTLLLQEATLLLRAVLDGTVMEQELTDLSKLISEYYCSEYSQVQAFLERSLLDDYGLSVSSVPV
jgi:hypothetical protein